MAEKQAGSHVPTAVVWVGEAEGEGRLGSTYWESGKLLACSPPTTVLAGGSRHSVNVDPRKEAAAAELRRQSLCRGASPGGRGLGFSVTAPNHSLTLWRREAARHCLSAVVSAQRQHLVDTSL